MKNATIRERYRAAPCAYDRVGMASPIPLRIEEVTERHLDDLGVLFGSDGVVDRCWCMWFLIPVKEFHGAGREGNRQALIDLVAGDTHPVGLLAYRDVEPVGWCAVGPRSRFARAIRTPTLRSRRGDDDRVWLVPCFFVHPDHRQAGVAGALLEAAVDLARRSGADAIEGFPLAGPKRRSSGSDLQTGVEPLFGAAGFDVDHRPSDNRVVMRRQLQAEPGQ